MRLDVFFTPLVVKPSDTSGRLVAIVDVAQLPPLPRRWAMAPRA